MLEDPGLPVPVSKVLSFSWIQSNVPAVQPNSPWILIRGCGSRSEGSIAFLKTPEEKRVVWAATVHWEVSCITARDGESHVREGIGDAKIWSWKRVGNCTFMRAASLHDCQLGPKSPEGFPA